MQVVDLRSAGNFRLGMNWYRKDHVPFWKDVLRALTFFNAQGVPSFQYLETATHIAAPRHFVLPGLPEVTDLCLPGEELEHFEDRVTSFLDKDQELAWAELEKADEGILVLPGGRGKTTLAAKKICQVGRHTIVFVHTLMLMGQWAERLEQWAGIPREDIGFVQGSAIELEKPVVIVSIPSLMKKTHAILGEARDKFGLVIFDESHHLSAQVFSQLAPIFRGKRFGLTATPRREDKLERIYQLHLGPVFHTSAYHSLTPKVVFKKLPFFNPDPKELNDKFGKFSFPKLWAGLASDKDRNRVLLADIDWYRAQGRQIMVLTRSKEHAHHVASGIRGCGVITSRVDKRYRAAELAKPVVVATLEIGVEGLDKVELDTVIFAMPLGGTTGGRFAQGVWRALRDVVAKQQPLILVYQDPFPPCGALCHKMRTAAFERKFHVSTETAAG
jgi:superfamily II DNA or RNA helicase